MSEFLWQTYHRLIAELEVTKHRYLYEKFDLNSRLTGVVGPRGVGKTTLLLQYIKENLYDSNDVFYFSADNTYFNEVSILEFVDQLYQTKNINIFFIDEIHKYANWNQELKNIYDSFPKIKVVFSGSSSIDLIHGAYDLSRRAKLIHMPGLSFREYLNLHTNQSFNAVSFDELIANHQSIAAELTKVGTITRYFKDYLSFGYYPFGISDGNDISDVYGELNNIIDKTIYEDIAQFYNLKTTNLVHFKRIINFLATIPPGTVSTNKIATRLQIDNKTAEHYLEILNRTGMVKVLYPDAHGNQWLTKPAKVYIDNTTLLHAVNTMLSSELDKGTLRELAFLQSVTGAGIKTFYPQKGDFKVNDLVFEIGGRNKTMKQVKTLETTSYIVKDDILVGYGSEIPLYLFGFLY